MIGQTISHYKILEKLGEGGMGVVYKARDMKLERTVALKFLPPALASSPDDIARFEHEARAISALNHPAIATIHDIGEADGSTFIVLEFISGGTLKSTVQRARSESADLPLADVVKFGIQIAEGLASAHRAGIIHRDVKSDNAMLTAEGNVKLADFGLAKLQNAIQVTRAGSTVGTAAYMSPEQMRGEDVDVRTDIFSLGVVLYELTTKHLPFRGEHDAALAYSIVNEEPRPAATLRADTPDGLWRVIERCLSKELTKRYQTADEVVHDLRNLALGAGGVAKTFPASRSRLVWIIAPLILLLGATGVYLFKGVSPPPGPDRKTIAVLPFVNMSSDPDQEYFSDGLSEELLNVLAKNPGLRVTSRTSSFSFKATDTDIKTIAAKLNVQHILEGSVRKSGNALRVTAQLIDVETDAHLWSETYDGTVDNIFALQDTISHAVAEVLKIVLLTKETGTRQRGTDPEAYNAYLLGKHLYDLQEDWKQAARYFRQALSIDSSYAPAWVGLSRTHSSQANDGSVPLHEGYQDARLEAEEALALDPDFAEAHAQIGWIKRRYDWDWIGADASFQRALELDPGNAEVLRGAAGLARTLGRFDQAIALMRRAIELDPVSPSLYGGLGLYCWYAGMLDESLAAHERSLQLNPQFTGGHASAGLVFLQQEKLDLARAEVLKEAEPDWRLYGLALVYHALGMKPESDSALAELIRGFQDEDAYQIAEIYAYRDEADKAFEWLERAYRQRDGGLPSIKGNPLLRSIEKDHRYAAFMKQMRLPL